MLGKETFNDCLGYIAFAEDEHTRYTKDLPKSGSCDHKGKEVYKVKSTTKFENWWYDNRVSYIDAKTFADYRTEYFKNGNQTWAVIPRNVTAVDASYDDDWWSEKTLRKIKR